jgi:hypothetical protein
MAFCPNCKGVIGQTDTVCPHCAHDFPEDKRDVTGRGLAYSAFATIALIVGQIVTGFGCVFTAIASIGSLSRGDLVEGLIRGPIIFFVLLALLVVFVRVQKL